MKTLEEVLELMEQRIDRPTLEDYITHEWIRPERAASAWMFDDMDIARLKLVAHLHREIDVNEHGMDVALSLLDQLYLLRTHLKSLAYAVTRQPENVRVEIFTLAEKMTKPN